MLWDCRRSEGAVACLNRMAPVTVVKFVGIPELLVAGEYGIAEITDLRTHTSVTTLMKPSEFDAKTKEVEGVWEGQLKNQHPILDACVSPTGDRVSILAWRPAGGVVEVFDSESWALVSQVNLATELPRISPLRWRLVGCPRAGGCPVACFPRLCEFPLLYSRGPGCLATRPPRGLLNARPPLCL